ncbi:MAG: glycosyltransferase family 2 protein [Desulfuromonadaceae bacterium]|nr:glycosyltransferase family 2 protein [Desulfuromonadaceae bacterium]MDD2848980.1 glycosyltransferase family 2 protein [Desulfuromonadaceae bacterium]MDD4130329.1 glycosyltransferase family 2 protein [Desulfuromonadaceae bacterium]
MMESLFYLFLFLTIYPYVVYPLLVIAWSRLSGRLWIQKSIVPNVSMIISVYNEEGVIREKIENALSLDYPKDLFEVVVVSDGSTDRTNEVLTSIVDPRLVLRIFPERNGKTACLNQVVPVAKGDILVFTDANSMFPFDTMRKLARNFADGRVGLVTGWTKYRKADGAEETAGLYARLERVVKYAESLVGSCVGADGAIFAMRKELYCPLKDYDINDFVIPLNVIGQRGMVVLDPEVYCIEKPSEGEAREFRRQVRITNRTLGALWRNSGFLNPARYGAFAFCLLSHKVIRFLVPFFFLGTFCVGSVLSAASTFYAVLTTAQLLFVVVGLFGMFDRSYGRLVQLCSFVLLTIYAQFIGWIRWSTGKSDVIWKPER